MKLSLLHYVISDEELKIVIKEIIDRDAIYDNHTLAIPVITPSLIASTAVWIFIIATIPAPASTLVSSVVFKIIIERAATVKTAEH